MINILLDILAHTTVISMYGENLVYDQNSEPLHCSPTEQNCINIMQSKTQILIRFECFDTG